MVVTLDGCGFRLLPRSNKKILQLGNDIMSVCVEFVGRIQGICIGFAFHCELVGNGGNDTALSLRFFKLLGAKKIPTQHSMLVGIATCIEPSGYGIRDGGFTRASFGGQPEDTGAVRRGVISPFGDIFQNIDACSVCALFTPQWTVSVVSLLGGMQTPPEGRCLFN